MDFEKLALEVSAAKAGLKPVSPQVVRGDSGIDHRVTLLFTDGAKLYGFDFYESVTEIEVVRSFAKKFDCKVNINLVSLTGEVTQGAMALANGYAMKVLSPKAAENFFAFEEASAPSAKHPSPQGSKD
jgi:hypothetical protein